MEFSMSMRFSVGLYWIHDADTAKLKTIRVYFCTHCKHNLRNGVRLPRMVWLSDICVTQPSRCDSWRMTRSFQWFDFLRTIENPDILQKLFICWLQDPCIIVPILIHERLMEVEESSWISCRNYIQPDSLRYIERRIRTCHIFWSDCCLPDNCIWF